MKNSLLLVPAVLIFLFASQAIGQDRVVVVPLGGSSSKAAGGIKVYDAADQYIGLLIGQDGQHVNIFNPSLNRILPINKLGGSLPNPLSSGYFLGYESADCTGQAYYIIPTPPVDNALVWAGHIVADPSPLHDYISFDFIGVNSVTTNSRAYSAGPTSCLGGGTGSGYHVAATRYQSADLPFTLPLSFPLRFDAGP